MQNAIWGMKKKNGILIEFSWQYGFSIDKGVHSFEMSYDWKAVAKQKIQLFFSLNRFLVALSHEFKKKKLFSSLIIISNGLVLSESEW